MKKLLILAAVSFTLISAVNAQAETALRGDMKTGRKEQREERKAIRKPEDKEVSYQAKEQFCRDFANADIISSERIYGYDEFTFIKDNTITKAYYDIDASLVGFTQEKTFADLPARAQQSIDKMYKGYSVAEVLYFDDNEFNEANAILYGYPFEDEDSYFVELQKDINKIVVHVNLNGEVGFYTRIR